MIHSRTPNLSSPYAQSVIADMNVSNDRYPMEFGIPWQFFCPAAVYEMVEESGDGAPNYDCM